MHITAVKVLVLFETDDDVLPEELTKLERFLETTEEEDSPVYDGANKLVGRVFQQAKQFGLLMKDKQTPARDFNINVSAIARLKRR